MNGLCFVAKIARINMIQKRTTGKKIQTQILNYCKKHNIAAFNIVAASVRGVPDILCCKDGKFVGVEVKGYGDIVRPLQEAIAKQILAAEGKHIFAHSLNEFIEFINLV